jgi:ATP-dependent Clp protease ATP-binding subunit ClpA
MILSSLCAASGQPTPKSDEEKYYAKMMSVVREELESELKPELLNRIDEVCVFQPLGNDNLRSIAELILSETISRAFDERRISLTACDSLLDAIINEGSPSAYKYGARPMRRAVQRFFEDTVSDAIIRGFVSDGDRAFVSLSKQSTLQNPLVELKREKDGKIWTCPVADVGGGTAQAKAPPTSATSTSTSRSEYLLTDAVKA